MMRRRTRRSSKISFGKKADDEYQNKLHNMLSMKQLIGLKDCFLKHPGRAMTTQAFRKALLETAHITMDDNVFHNLCRKLKYASTSTDIRWTEVLTLISVGLESENTEHCAGKLELPISGSPKELKTHHRLPINKILFMPEMQNRKIDHLYGSYVTCSRDGLINYWSMDMEKQKTVYSKNTLVKSSKTWITDIVALPDVNVICTSSTERDLRFFDTTANKFELRIVITSLEDMVSAMSYNFYDDINKESKLVIGFYSGKVKLILIQTKDRGPFQSLPKMPLRNTTHQNFVKGSIKGMRQEPIPTLHTEWVRQVGYYEGIHCVVSISTCSKESMLIHSSKSKKCRYSFHVSKGFSCFAIAEALHMVITGGLDFLVRMWNPFVPSRPITVLRGHHGGIASITLQDDNNILITLDNAKCIKVWDISEQICLQSYYELPSSLGERTSLCTYYNPCSRGLFVASHKIAYIQIYPLLHADYTDGVSHRKEVSVILYNRLYKTVITCGFDSFIIMWNPWEGKRSQFIQNAHTYELNGRTIPVEITAATFDYSQQFLITGAGDGTLKIWNFIEKACIRNMATTKGFEIYSIVWLKYRILVMGENRLVTEFADGEDIIGSTQSKTWLQRHQDEILCSAHYRPKILVTGSYGGELVFWRMETGQPYGIYNVMYPKQRLNQYHNLLFRKKKRRVISPCIKKPRETEHIIGKKKKTMMMEASSYTTRRISVNAMISLTKRKVHPQIGTLIVALDNGIIQLWSLHPGGGFLTEFSAVHNVRDYVVSLCTDENNKYLFTGHMAGYIKTWHLINFGIPEEDQIHVCMPKLRLHFPFLWKDTILGRAKRAHRSDVPLLLNSFKAHLKPVTGIEYIDTPEILMSCSSDASARIWTLGGRYMGTLGTFKKPWIRISPIAKPTETRPYPLPADIQRSASFTTHKVLCGGNVEKTKPSKKQQMYDQIFEESHRCYGKRIDLDNVLGKHFKLPERGFKHFHIDMNKAIQSIPEIPIYSELVLPMPVKIKRIPTPELIKNVKAQLMITTQSSFERSFS